MSIKKRTLKSVFTALCLACFLMLSCDDGIEDAIDEENYLATHGPYALYPKPGNAGHITISDIYTNSLTVNWTAATDTDTPPEELQYKLYYSSIDDINSVANCQTNGTEASEWMTTTSTFQVTGLTTATTYYFNILVKDPQNQMALYRTTAITTSSVNFAPAPGGDGLLTINAITDTTLTITWHAASDLETPVEELQYSVYISDGYENLLTHTIAHTSGTPILDWRTNVFSAEVSNLIPGTKYYAAVFTKDGDENIAGYTIGSAITLVYNETPVPGDSGKITPLVIDSTSISVYWPRAVDNSTEQNSLEYAVFFSTRSDITTYEEALLYGMESLPWSTGIHATLVPDLTPGTEYHFYVFVRDGDHNIAMYNPIAATPLIIGTPPVPGNSGAIIVANIEETAALIQWNGATDVETDDALLQYRIYLKTITSENRLNEELGSIVKDWSTGSSSINLFLLQSLTAGSEYKVFILVRDSDGLTGLYSSDFFTIQPKPVLTAPLPGGPLSAITTTNSIAITWPAATDADSDDSALLYEAYYSIDNNIATYTEAVTNGTQLFTWQPLKYNETINSLTPGSTYYITVFVKDSDELMANYTTINATTQGSGSAPSAGIINNIDIFPTSIRFTWTAATDIESDDLTLEYIVYRSIDDPLTTYADALLYGTAQTGWVVNGSFLFEDNTLHGGNTYYYNVFVRDGDGMVSAYAGIMVITTYDGNPPDVSADPVVVPSNIEETQLKLNWTYASDIETPVNKLEYIVYYSTENNISTFAHALKNGTIGMDWTQNNKSATVTGLSANTLYYFTVFVRDEDSNISAYNSVSQSTD